MLSIKSLIKPWFGLSIFLLLSVVIYMVFITIIYIHYYECQIRNSLLLLSYFCFNHNLNYCCFLKLYLVFTQNNYINIRFYAIYCRTCPRYKAASVMKLACATMWFTDLQMRSLHYYNWDRWHILVCKDKKPGKDDDKDNNNQNDDYLLK